MTRLAALLWVIGGATLAGVFMIVVLMTPSMQFEAGRYILIAAIAGFVVAIPLSLAAARIITAKRTG